MRVENQTKTPVWEASSLCPETSTKHGVQEFHLGTPPPPNPPLMLSPVEENGKSWGIILCFLLLQLLRKFASLPASPSFPCSGCTISPSIVWPTDIQKSGIHSQQLCIYFKGAVAWELVLTISSYLGWHKQISRFLKYDRRLSFLSNYGKYRYQDFGLPHIKKF